MLVNISIKKIFTGNSALMNIVYASLYIITFSYIWKSYCVPVWHAYNYKDITHSLLYNIIGYFIALFPIIFYRGIKKVSSWIAIILYYFGYVPIVLGLLFNYPANNNYHVTEYWIVLLIAMSMYFHSDKISIKLKHSKQKLSMNFIWYFAVLTIFTQIIFYHHNMRIVDFRSIYELRAENALIGKGFINYLNSWSSTFTFPLVFIFGLFKKNKKIILLGALSFLFLYSIFGAKSDLFAPIIIFAFYKFFLWQEKKNINLLSIFTLGIGLLTLLLLFNLENEIAYFFAAVFLMRTLTISGVLFAGYYLPFFQNHPHTYFSHVNIINAITDSNPYKGEAIGKVVSEGGMNANAIFWAMDGITAMGVLGVAIVSILFYVFLIFINGLSTPQNKTFLSILMIVPTMSLLNTSFFTFLLSEGVLLILLTMFFFDLQNDKQIITN